MLNQFWIVLAAMTTLLMGVAIQPQVANAKPIPVLVNQAKTVEQLKEVANNTMDNEVALIALGKAIQITPQDAELYAMRARTRTAMDDLQGAIADYTQALNLGIESPQHVYYGRAWLYEMSGNLTAALADNTQFLQLLAPEARKGLYHVRALTYQKLGEHQKAIADFSIDLDFWQGNSDELYQSEFIHYQRAQSYIALGNIVAAKQDLETSLKLCDQMSTRSDNDREAATTNRERTMAALAKLQ